MPIWKLKPLDSNDVNWGSSKHYGSAVARASDEQAARSLASQAFFEFPQYFGGDIPIDPWTHDSCSSCTQLENSGYTEEGADELLAPLGRVERMANHRTSWTVKDRHVEPLVDDEVLGLGLIVTYPNRDCDLHIVPAQPLAGGKSENDVALEEFRLLRDALNDILNES